MTVYDWTRFKRQIFIKAPVADVFAAWAVPQNIVKWFIAYAEVVDGGGQPRAASEPVQSGDRYYWRWHQDLETRGAFLAVVENELLRFTFGNKTAVSDEKVIVTVRVVPEVDCTRLELVQENMADTPDAHAYWHMGCNMGWSFFMTNLKGLLEHRVDLRETDPERAYASRAITL